jgi:hypothetical protein
MRFNIVTCVPIPTQRIGKHIPATHMHNNRTSVARQWTCKHATLTIEDGVFRGVRPEAV